MGVELPIEDPILQFTILVTVALIVQLTLERLPLPGLVGLLAAGMLLGPGGLGLLPRGEVMELLGAVGLVYIMFMAGLELDLDVVREHRRESITFGLLAFFLSLMPAAIVGRLMGFSFQAAILLGTLLSSHTLLAYPMVERMGLTSRLGVVAAVGGTLLTDTFALVALAVVLQFGGDSNGSWSWIMPLVLLAVLTASALWIVPKVGRFVFDQAPTTRAEDALFALVVLLLLASIAELIGTHEILGAFLAGLCLNQPLNRRDVLREHIEFVGRMLFIPFFFVSTGMLLELAVFTEQWETWIVAGLLLGVVLFGKTAASWITGTWYDYPPLERVLMVGLTIPQAAATLAVTITAQQANLFEDKVVDAVIVLIFVTCLFGPLLTRWAGQRLKQ